MGTHGAGPHPWVQHQLRTTFLRVPTNDWSAVKTGIKTEFRASGRAASQLWNVKCPTPVVAYTRFADERYDSRLMVLMATWQEALDSISPESLEREGFETFAHFRRYWMERHKRRFHPLTQVHVYRLRPFHVGDRAEMAEALLMRLYGEHL